MTASAVEGGVEAAPALTVPVIVRSDLGVQFGWVRKVDRRGALVELATLPPLGSAVEVVFELEARSRCATSIHLPGRVQHVRLWRTGNVETRLQPLRQMTVRWVSPQVDDRSAVH